MKPSRRLDFIAWLKDRGCDVRKVTSTWELVRWVANGTTSIIYRNKYGRLSHTGESQFAWDAFNNGGAYRVESTVRKKLPAMVGTILDRDGILCFYCGDVMELPPVEAPNMATIEHLVSLSAGGPNHSSNIALACRECNQKAGSMSVVEKVQLRDELRKRSSEHE